MSVELIPKHWCDNCQRRERSKIQEVDPNSEGVITIDLGQGLRELDICTRCDAEMSWRDMRTLYVSHGRPPAKLAKSVRHALKVEPPAVASRDAWPCLWCTGSFHDNSAATKHMRSIHRFSVNDIPRDCPLCDKYSGDRNARKLSGVNRHLTERHNGISVYTAYLTARDSGDSRGLWAQLLANRSSNESEAS